MFDFPIAHFFVCVLSFELQVSCRNIAKRCNGIDFGEITETVGFRCFAFAPCLRFICVAFVVSLGIGVNVACLFWNYILHRLRFFCVAFVVPLSIGVSVARLLWHAMLQTHCK